MSKQLPTYSLSESENSLVSYLHGLNPWRRKYIFEHWIDRDSLHPDVRKAIAESLPDETELPQESDSGSLPAPADQYNI